MVLKYIKVENPQPNIRYYKLKNGTIKQIRNNKNYIKKERKIEPNKQKLEQLADLYEVGVPIKQLIKRFNLSYYSFSNLVKKFKWKRKSF